MSRLRRFRRGKRFLTGGEGVAATAGVLAESGPSENFKLVIAALGNLKKAEADFKLTKESDLEKLVLSFAAQAQTAIDPDALLAWKQSVLAAEAKRADLLGALEFAEEELTSLAKEFAQKDAPTMMKAVEELFELLHAAKEVEGSPAPPLVHAEAFLRELKKAAQASAAGKKAARKSAKKPEGKI
jgi:hypothetical protein